MNTEKPKQQFQQILDYICRSTLRLNKDIKRFFASKKKQNALISKPKRYWLTGLSGRLLGLTIIFVMLAEVLIFLPSIGNALRGEIRERIRDADHFIDILEQIPRKGLGRELDRLLLDYTDAELFARAGHGSSKIVFNSLPKTVTLRVNLLEDSQWILIVKALQVLSISDEDAVMSALGFSPLQNGSMVEMLFLMKPVRDRLLQFSLNIMALSLVISLITALLVYAALSIVIVRPVQHLTQAMVDFAKSPLSMFDTVGAERREDEVGEATRSLVAMRQTVRNSLVQNQRLASLGTGIAQINHDLRNLLGSALLLSEQLETSNDPLVQEKIPQITKSISAAAELCACTLSFAREGSVHLHKKPYRISAMMAELEWQLNTQFPEINVEIAVPEEDQEAESQLVSVDMIQLERVLRNLIQNAQQADAVTIWVDACEDALGQWFLELSDDGSGFDQSALERLFEPFSASTKKDGTGLGLYNAREILRAHGGDLHLVNPGPKVGVEATTFKLTFSSDFLLGSRHD